MDDKTVVDAFLDTVMNQIATGDPPETKVTLDRLMSEGYSKPQALQAIAQTLRIEMNRMLSEATPFDNARYADLLAKIKAEG